MHGDNFILLQDNAPCHRARVTKEYLEERRVNTIPWPPNSPDLNIRENCWGMMFRGLHEDCRQFRSINELKRAIYAEWEKIPQDYIEK